MKPILLGCSGPVLLAEEAAFFSQAQPFGFILFARNCIDPEQLKKLTQDLRACVGRQDAPIFVDQEGGRVARLKPPHWPALPAAGVIGALFEKESKAGAEAARLHVAITAQMLRDVGINGNCAPLLDLSLPETSNVMGDRTFSSDPQIVAALGRIFVEAYLAQGILPVVKHMPGHGRVKVDPHETLPFVDDDLQTLERADFLPFQSLCDAPIGMNCHVVFKALDPMAPVSLSSKVHSEIIRGKIGFKGLIFSDDLDMGALSLPIEQKGILALKAGADIVLFCPGKLADNALICRDLPAISDQTLALWARAINSLKQGAPVDIDKAKTRLDQLLAS